MSPLALVSFYRKFDYKDLNGILNYVFLNVFENIQRNVCNVIIIIIYNYLVFVLYIVTS